MDSNLDRMISAMTLDTLQNDMPFEMAPKCDTDWTSTPPTPVEEDKDEEEEPVFEEGSHANGIREMPNYDFSKQCYNQRLTFRTKK